MSDKIKLTGRELEIMNILWETGIPMAAKDFLDVNPSLSINTVQWALKTLLNRGYIEVAGVGYSNTVLARNYLPVFSADEYLVNQMMKSNICKNISVEGVIAAFLKEKSDKKTIEKLEGILQQYRDDI